MNDKFVIIEPNQSLHAEAVMDLAAKNFHGYWEFRDYCTSGYISGSHYDWKASRIGMVGNKAVSHYGVWGFKMRIGTDAVRTGGIGAVCTDKPYRKKGYLAATAKACINAMRECGYDISLLFGIPNFYQKFRYVKAWDDSSCSLKSASLTSLPAQPIKLHKFHYTSNSWTDKIANSTNAGLTGTAVRPTYGKSRTKEKDTCWYWKNRKDEPSGYVMIRNDGPALQLIDWGGKPNDVLAAVSKLTNTFHSATINIRALHARSELFAELQNLAYRMETDHNPNGGAMIRVLNLVTLLNRIRRTLSSRLKASGLSDWQDDLLIEMPTETVILSARTGRIEARQMAAGESPPKHKIAAGQEIAQLIIGLHPPDEIISKAQIRCSGDARKLVQALFPAQMPTLGAWDHF